MTNLIEDAAETAATALAPEAAIPAKVGAWMFADGWRLACAALLFAVAAQQVRIEGLTLRPHIGPVGVTLIDLPGWRPRALAAEKTLAAVKVAQPKAAAAQAAVNHQPAVISAAIAKASDHDAPAYYAKGRSASDAYATAHPAGGVCSPRAESGTGHADLPGGDHAAPQHDGPGDAPGMVAVARADFDQLTANSLRLAKVHQDAESLIAGGVAVEEGK